MAQLIRLSARGRVSRFASTQGPEPNVSCHCHSQSYHHHNCHGDEDDRDYISITITSTATMHHSKRSDAAFSESETLGVVHATPS